MQATIKDLRLRTRKLFIATLLLFSGATGTQPPSTTTFANDDAPPIHTQG
ncbi:hypothetical protein [Litchfieldella anticariensis]|nr:hypothetical protein [Halomonas anticariensis]